MFAAATLLLALVGITSAHMEVQFPPPLNSKFNPNTPSGQADYNMIAPLLADGSNFPCKGYQSLLGTAAGKATASFAVGGQGNMTITGGANHGGGSCQISLSTDGAKTFTVINSIEGNCPTAGTSNLDFTVPADAPTGDAVLAWTWFNEIGNREMYMNCAAVTLTAGANKRRSRFHHRRAAAYSTRPGIFIANVGSAGGGCTTKEGVDLQFPQAGPDVVSTGSKLGAPTCGVTQKTGSGSGSSSGSSGSGSSSSSAASAAPSSSSSSAAGGGGGGVFATASPSVSVAATPAAATTLTSSTAQATATAAPSAAQPSAASAGTAAAAPAAAASSSSSSSSGSTNTPGTACTTEGAWVCSASGGSFQRCASGLWSAVMAMAPGTTCAGSTSEKLNMVAIAR